MQRLRIGACVNVGWFKDYNDPQSLLMPTFDGNAISSRGNVNWSLLNVHALNAEMQRATTLTGTARIKAWAKINHDISSLAPAIPYIWDTDYQTASANVNTRPVIGGKAIDAIDGYYGTWNLSLLSLK
jgi:peptide/nickel transport system substrate-binding protein